MKLETTIDRMKARHRAEIEELQNNCPHNRVTPWQPHYWAPGHADGTEARICLECGKILERRRCKLETFDGTEITVGTFLEKEFTPEKDK